MTEQVESSKENDIPLVPGRFQEKAQLQDLNQRLSHYLHLARINREKEVSFT